MEHIERLFRHLVWADEAVASAIAAARASGDARELYAHLVGTEAVWLARLRGDTPVEVWPDPDRLDLAAFARDVHGRYRAWLDGVDPTELRRPVEYVNSAGRSFTSSVEDILLHVFLHGAYHRGQIAWLLRSGGAEPAPSDYIAFARGAPAATRADSG